MSERFKSINADGDPGDQNPTLAENYRLRTPENLYPGDIVHPVVYSAIARDELSQKLYINADVEFGPEADNPDDYKDRFGIMRVYLAVDALQEGEEPEYDGYLVDLRFVQPEHIDTIDVDMSDPNYDDDMMFGDPLPVLGYIYLDTDGDVAYNGHDDPRIIETALYLRDAVDIVREGQDEDILDDEATDKGQSRSSKSTGGRAEADALGIVGNLQQPSASQETPKRKWRLWGRDS